MQLPKGIDVIEGGVRIEPRQSKSLKQISCPRYVSYYDIYGRLWLVVLKV